MGRRTQYHQPTGTPQRLRPPFSLGPFRTAASDHFGESGVDRYLLPVGARRVRDVPGQVCCVDQHPSLVIPVCVDAATANPLPEARAAEGRSRRFHGHVRATCF